MAEQLSHPENSHPNAGRKSMLSKYLEKNPALRLQMAKAAALPDSAELDYTDIETVDDLIEYACFELTRSKNEGLLRGKTFCEYAKAFASLFEMKKKLLHMERETCAVEETARRNREEIAAFVTVVFEAFTAVIEDSILRQKLSEKIKTLYEQYYPEQSGGQKSIADGNGGQGVDLQSGDVSS